MNVATTVDASGNMKLYINGALAATATGVALTTGVRDFNYIGRSNWEANGDGRFDGAVDSFMVANVAMSAADIAALSNQTTGFTVAENSANGTSLGTVVGSDPDATGTKTYSLTNSAGGAFAINSSTGEVTVADASLLNYEAGTTKTITVQVADQAGASYSESVTVNLTNVNEAPTITSNGAGATASISVAENQTAVTTVTSTDVDASATATYTISGGADASKFAINASTGVLTFVSAPNFEGATDFGANNVYDVIVQVSDGSLTDTQAIAVTVTNVNEAPTITSSTTVSIAENQTSVMTVTSSDPDASPTATYSIVGGVDAALFAINSSTGALTFVSAPNYERAIDTGLNNVYDVTVQVTDGGLTTSSAVAVTVTNVNEASVALISNNANLLTNGNFDTPLVTNLNADNLQGSTWGGWTSSGSINPIRVNGTGYNVGADNADSGTQFVDIASSATLTQSFTLSSAQTISFGASFSNRDLSSGGFVVPTTTVEIVNASNVVVATANLTRPKRSETKPGHRHQLSPASAPARIPIGLIWVTSVMSTRLLLSWSTMR